MKYKKKDEIEREFGNILLRLYIGSKKLRDIYKKIENEFYVQERKKFIVKLFEENEKGNIIELAYPELDFFEDDKLIEEESEKNRLTQVLMLITLKVIFECFIG